MNHFLHSLFAFSVLLLPFPEATVRAEAQGEDLASTVLSPFKAIRRDRVRCASGFHDGGFAGATDDANCLLAVFMSGFAKDSKLSKEQLDWQLLDASGEKKTAIGLGLPVPGFHVQLVGVVTKGYITDFSCRQEPLIALIYIVPRKIEAFSLVGPTGSRHNVKVESGWFPERKHHVFSFGVGGAMKSHLGGAGWTSGLKPK